MKKTCFLCLAVFLFAFGRTGYGKADTGVVVRNLRLEMKENPLGVNVTDPRFSWQLASDKPGLLQTAYRVQVAATPESLANEKDLVWDSGDVRSDASVLVPYGGKGLESGRPYFWRVKLHTNQGETGWSGTASWSMALLADSDWKATWIGEDSLSNPGEVNDIGPGEKAVSYGANYGNRTRLAARYLRKEFSAGKPVRRAVLYISGPGSCEAYLNGKKVSEDVFAPMPSLYWKRVYYNVYDVTGLMEAGTNTLGVVLGNGRFFSMRGGQINFGLPQLLAQLEIEYADGSTATVVSDETWKVTSKGPIVANNEYDGEEYDARLEMPGWNQNGFDDSGWRKPDVMDDVLGAALTAQQNPNMRIQETVRPVAIHDRPDGKYILDMGQNMVGWLDVRLKGKKDRPVSLRFAELLQKDGSLDVENLKTAKATDVYIPARDGAFNWHPCFVYHGFRFVEVSGLDYKPALEDFTGCVLYDRMATTGHFEASNPLATQIYKNVFWTIRGNYRGMPTDNPNRHERQGWLGDRGAPLYGEAFVFDNSRLYDKWAQDIEDSMSPEGSISADSPSYWIRMQNDATYPSTFFYAADMLYRQFGDDRAIRAHYASMKKWMQYMQETSMKDHIILYEKYGDWLMPPESPELIHSKDPARKTDGRIQGTAIFYDLLHKMARFARICGQDADIAGYEALAARMKESYNEKFFNKETAQYGNNTVTANILSLYLGLVPEGYEGRVFDNIVKKTEEDYDGHVSSGFVGMRHLMRGLTEYGRVDLAYRILTNETYPSWGYMVKKGATTIWELWNGDTADRRMNSHNQIALTGDLITWYYEDLAGIKCAPDAVGFKKIVMKPVFPDGLDSVSASYESVYGEIRSAWSKKKGAFRWDVTIPGNATAIVCIPKKYKVEVEGIQGIRKVSETDEQVEVEVGSGSYTFKGI